MRHCSLRVYKCLRPNTSPNNWQSVLLSIWKTKTTKDINANYTWNALGAYFGSNPHRCSVQRCLVECLLASILCIRNRENIDRNVEISSAANRQYPHPHMVNNKQSVLACLRKHARANIVAGRDDRDKAGDEDCGAEHSMKASRLLTVHLPKSHSAASIQAIESFAWARRK